VLYAEENLNSGFSDQEVNMDCPCYEQRQYQWCNARAAIYLPGILEIKRYCKNGFDDCFHYAAIHGIQRTDRAAGSNTRALQGD